MNKLYVYWDKQIVGYLWQQDDASMAFQYCDEWIQKNCQPISLSLPLSKDIYTNKAHRFFANLLPEGDFRANIEQILKISQGNDFALLAAIGGDCAGALSISRKLTEFDKGYYVPFTNMQLEDLLKSGVLPYAKYKMRLSLAGAQGKLPVYYLNKQLHLPYEGAVSTHILKYNRINGIFKNIVENEFYITTLAKLCGLNVVDMQIIKIKDYNLLLSKRYDRVHKEFSERLHQEDFCQAMGFMHMQKYEAEGGPSFVQCMEFARKYFELVEIKELIRWYMFNLIIGNSDAHAKNISLVYCNGNIKLAPFYDLVCTRAYVKVDTALAMSCAGCFNPDEITSAKLEVFSKNIGVNKNFVLHLAQEIVELINQKKGIAQKELEGYVDIAKTQQLLQTIDKLCLRFSKKIGK